MRKSVVGDSRGAGFARAASRRGAGCARGADPFRRELSAVARVSADSTAGRGARYLQFARVAAGRRNYSAAGVSNRGRSTNVSYPDTPGHGSGTWIGHVARYRTVVLGCGFCGRFGAQDAQGLSARPDGGRVNRAARYFSGPYFCVELRPSCAASRWRIVGAMLCFSKQRAMAFPISS